MTRRRNNVVHWPPAIMDKQEDYELVHVREVERELAWLERQRQNRIAKLRRLKALWDAEDDERIRRRVSEIAIEIQRERIRLERENEIEAEHKKVRDWYMQELEKERQAADEMRRKKLKQITAEVNRDTVRTEREELIRRGVYRGR